MRLLAFALCLVFSFSAVAAETRLSRPPAGLPVLPVADHAQWQAVGRINRAGYRRRDMCSGALISPDRVLTAAHCLIRRDGTPVDPSDVTFVAGWLRGEYAEAARGKSVRMAKNVFSNGKFDLRRDIAVLVLEHPLSVPPLPLASATPVAPFAIVAYSGHRPHMLGARFDCEGTPGPVIMRINCPVRHGNSGGPVLSMQNGSWHVAGVVSALSKDSTLAVPVTAIPAP